MADISNKTLALLVGVALVVSLIGIVSGPSGITGRAANTGTADLEVLGAVIVSLEDNNINFLSGSIEASLACSIDSEDGDNSAGCTAASGWLSGADIFTVNNTGTVNISLNIKSNSTAGEWIGGTGPLQYYKVIAAEADCRGTSTTAETSLTTGDTLVCDDVAPASGIDVAMNISIPNDAPQGAREETITFTGTIV